MIVGLQDSLQAIEQKMTSCFTKIERRLDSLEERMITQSELVSKTSLLQVYNELELGYTFQKFGGHCFDDLRSLCCIFPLSKLGHLLHVI